MLHFLLLFFLKINWYHVYILLLAEISAFNQKFDLWDISLYRQFFGFVEQDIVLQVHVRMQVILKFFE